MKETPEERRERWRSITIGGRGPALKPTNPNAVRPMDNPVWEGTPVKDHRGVPYVHASNPDLPVTAKQFADRRGHYENQIKDLRNAPAK